MKTLQRIILVAAIVGLCGCSGFEQIDSEPVQTPVDVVLSVGGVSSTKTVYDTESRNFVWTAGDKMSVWAKAQDGSYALNGQTFNLLTFGGDRSKAYFTATLQSPMEEGTYSYYMTYPLPESVEGTVAKFSVPAVQDGTASDGVDIIVVEPVTGPALSPLVEAAPIDPGNVLSVSMKHLLHYLRFYIPEGQNVLGEPVKRIEFTMPSPVAGDVSVDVTDPSTANLSNGKAGMRLDLKTPIEDKDGSAAVAGIFPPSDAYGSEDQMTVTVYSDNKWSTLTPFSLSGRTFTAGHQTPVPVKPKEAKPLLWFTLASNNLGEDPQNVKVALPAGENWPGTNSNVLAFTGEHDGFVKVGDSFVLKFNDDEALQNLSSKALTVTYESESAIVTENVTLGDLSTGQNSVCSLNCPYLFFEDFSGVEYFSSEDEYKTSSAGSKKPKTFLSGWSAARAGAQEGTAIRIACRRETAWFGLGIYSARADSPILRLKDNVKVNLDVTFNYAMNQNKGGFSPVDVSQTVYFGHIKATYGDGGIDVGSGLESGDGSGTFSDQFVLNETSGSYSNINHVHNTILSNVESPARLCWRTVPEEKTGANNNTCWLYIDNIKVKIKK